MGNTILLVVTVVGAVGSIGFWRWVRRADSLKAARIQRLTTRQRRGAIQRWLDSTDRLRGEHRSSLWLTHDLLAELGAPDLTTLNRRAALDLRKRFEVRLAEYAAQYGQPRPAAA